MARKILSPNKPPLRKKAATSFFRCSFVAVVIVDVRGWFCFSSFDPVKNNSKNARYSQGRCDDSSYGHCAFFIPAVLCLHFLSRRRRRYYRLTVICEHSQSLLI